MITEELRKYLRVAFDGANDGGAAAALAEPAAGEGDGAAGDPGAAADANVGDAAAADAAAGDAAAATPAKKQPSPIIAELSQQRARRREAEERAQKSEERAAKAEREAAEANALADRLAKGQAGDAPPLRQPVAVTVPAAADVNLQAERIVFERDINTLKSRAFATFGEADFNASIASLAAVGAADDDFVKTVMDVDPENAHVILHELAQDDARALGIAKMNPIQRIKELTKMSIAQQAKATKEPGDKGVEPNPAPGKPAARISAAPRPAPAIAASSSGKDLPRFADKKSDAEFDKDFDDWGKRRSRR
jgi:hypothetical protein